MFYIVFVVCIITFLIRRTRKIPEVSCVALVIIGIVELFYFWIFKTYENDREFHTFKASIFTDVYIIGIALALAYQVKLAWFVFRETSISTSLRIGIGILTVPAFFIAFFAVIGDFISLLIICIPIVLIVIAIAKSDSSAHGEKGKAQWEIDYENQKSQSSSNDEPRTIRDSHGDTWERTSTGRYRREGEWTSPSKDRRDID